MEIKLIAGNRNEEMINLVKKTVENCQNEMKWCEAPHEEGSCRNCRRCSKYECDLMRLCDKYGFEKVYDAVFYAYGGSSQTVKGMEAFIWETITEEEYGLYLEMLSSGKIMAS